MKIINGERVALSPECVQREGRTMSYIDGSGLTTEEYLMPSPGERVASEHSSDSAHPATSGTEPIHASTPTSFKGGYAPSGTSPGRSGPFGAVRLT